MRAAGMRTHPRAAHRPRFAPGVRGAVRRARLPLPRVRASGGGDDNVKPRAPKPYVASCATCHTSKTFAGEFPNPREYLESKGWYAAARSRGPMAWYCPLHVPRGNPRSLGSSTPCAPCQWAHDRRVAATDTTPPRRPAICVLCGRREMREVGDPHEALDDYDKTVAKFTKPAAPT